MFSKSVIIVKTYEGQKAYGRGLEKMAKKGYRATDVQTEVKKKGCLNPFFIVGMLLDKGTTIYTVTFELIPEVSE